MGTKRALGIILILSLCDCKIQLELPSTKGSEVATIAESNIQSNVPSPSDGTAGPIFDPDPISTFVPPPPLPPGVPTSKPLTGTPGVWENVSSKSTPLIRIDPAFHKDGNNFDDNFAVQDVLADPSRPGVFYAFVCYQGVWRSDDWGLNWTQVDTDNTIKQGRPWGEAIAQDGSYMLAAAGYGPKGVWKSVNGGVTWTAYHFPAGTLDDPYSFDIDPSNKSHVIASSHSLSNLYESTDGGESWVDRGAMGTGGSNYVFFVGSSLFLSVSDNVNINSAFFNFSATTKPLLSVEASHNHGNAQILVDNKNGNVFVPRGAEGLYLCKQPLDNKSCVSVGRYRADTMVATDTKIYTSNSGATLGFNDPSLQVADRDGTGWQAPWINKENNAAGPAGMTNGAKRFAAVKDPTTGKWVIVSGNWNAGIWRYIEP